MENVLTMASHACTGAPDQDIVTSSPAWMSWSQPRGWPEGDLATAPSQQALCRDLQRSLSW